MRALFLEICDRNVLECPCCDLQIHEDGFRSKERHVMFQFADHSTGRMVNSAS